MSASSTVSRQLESLCTKLTALSSNRRRRRPSWNEITDEKNEADPSVPPGDGEDNIGQLLASTAAALLRFLTPRLFVDQLEYAQQKQVLDHIVGCVTIPTSGATDIYWLVRFLASGIGGNTCVRELSSESPFFASALTLISNFEADVAPLVIRTASHMYAAGITCRSLKQLIRVAQCTRAPKMRAAALDALLRLSDRKSLVGEETSDSSLKVPSSFFGFSGQGDGISVEVDKWPFKQRDFSFWTTFRAERFDAPSSIRISEDGSSTIKRNSCGVHSSDSTSRGKPKRRGFFGALSSSISSEPDSASRPTASDLDMSPIHDVFQHLFLIVANDGHYIDIGFQGNMLAVRTGSGPKNRTQQHVLSSFPLIEKTWYKVGVVCSKPSFFRGTELRVYLNGNPLGASIQFSFPKPSTDRGVHQLRACHFGLNFTGQLGPTFLLEGSMNERLIELLHNPCYEGVDSALDMPHMEIRNKMLIGFHPRCHATDETHNNNGHTKKRPSKFLNLGLYNSNMVGSSNASTAANSIECFHGRAIGNAYSWTVTSVRDVLGCAGGVDSILPLLGNSTNHLLAQCDAGELPDLQSAHSMSCILRIVANMLRGHAVNQANAIRSHFMASLGHLLGEFTASLSFALSSPPFVMGTLWSRAEFQRQLKELACHLADSLEYLLEAIIMPTYSGVKSSVKTPPNVLSDNVLHKRSIESELLEYVAFNFDIWRQAPESLQNEIVKMMTRYTSRNLIMIRRVIGVQHMLDAIREHYSGNAGLYCLRVAEGNRDPNRLILSNREVNSPVRRSILKMIGMQLSASERTHETSIISKDEVSSILQFIVDSPCAAAVADILSLLHLLMSQPQPPSNLYSLLSLLSTSKHDKQDDRIGLAFPFLLLSTGVRLAAAYERESMNISNHIDSEPTCPSNQHKNIGKEKQPNSTEKVNDNSMATSNLIFLIPSIIQVIGVYMSRWDSCGSQQRRHSGRSLFTSISNNEGTSTSGKISPYKSTGSEWKGTGDGTLTNGFAEAGGVVLLSQLLDKPILGWSGDGSAFFGALLDMLIVGDNFITRHFLTPSKMHKDSINSVDKYDGAGKTVFSCVLMDDSETIVNPCAILLIFRHLHKSSYRVLGQALQLLLLIINMDSPNRCVIGSQSGWQHSLYSFICRLAINMNKPQIPGTQISHDDDDDEHSQVIAMALKLLSLLMSEDFLHNPHSWKNLFHFAALTRHHINSQNCHSASGTNKTNDGQTAGNSTKIISSGSRYDVSYVSLVGELCIQIARAFSQQFREHIMSFPEVWHKDSTECTNAATSEKRSSSIKANNITPENIAMTSLVMESMILVEEPGVAVGDQFFNHSMVNGSNAAINLINFAAFVESVLLENRCTFDGRIVKLPLKVVQIEESDDVNDWVKIPKDENVSSASAMDVSESPKAQAIASDPDNFKRSLACMGDAQSLMLLRMLFKTLGPILESPSEKVRNSMLWTACGNESGAAFRQHGALIHVLLRAALLQLEIIPPSSREYIAATQCLSLLVKVLVVPIQDRAYGMRPRRVSTNFDEKNALRSRNNSPVIRNRKRSLSDEDFAVLAHAAVASKESNNQLDTSPQARGKHSGDVLRKSAGSPRPGISSSSLSSSPSSSSLSPFILKEDEQWIIIIAIHIHQSLTGIRESLISGTTHTNETQFVAEDPLSKSRKETKKVDVLEYTAVGSRLRRLSTDLEIIEAEVQAANTVANLNLKILANLFEGSRRFKDASIFSKVLPREYFDAVEQFVESTANAFSNTGKIQFDTSINISCSSNISEDSQRDPAVSVNEAVESMLVWCYSPWLMLPDTVQLYAKACSVPLSERDCSFVLSTSQEVIAQNRSHRFYEFRWQNEDTETCEYQSVIEISNEPQSRLRHIEVNRRAAREVHIQDQKQSADERWTNYETRFELEKQILMSAYSVASSWSGRVSQYFNDCSIVHHWKLANHEDCFRQRRVLVPNQSFDPHEGAVYGNGKSKSPDNIRQKLVSLTKTVSPVKMLRNPAERNSESEISESDISESEVDNDDDGIDSDSVGDSGEQDNDNASSTKLLRGCSEDDSFDDFTFIGSSSDANSSLLPGSMNNIGQRLKNSNYRAFSLQKGERILFSSVTCKNVKPSRVLGGRLDISNRHLFFYPSRDKDDTTSIENNQSQVIIDKSAKKNRRWRVDDIVRLYTRRYLLCNNAVEIFFSDQSTVFFVFGGGSQERAEVLSHLLRLPLPKLSDATRSAIAHAASKKGRKRKVIRKKQYSESHDYFSLMPSLAPSRIAKASGLTELWQQRKISNFEYIMHLNTVSGRSYNDITQYPVFPWIISDYTSKKLDFSNTKEAKGRTFRDLSKPVGALNSTRLNNFISRYNSFDEDLAGVPRFHYGSHYSSAGIVLHYLLRKEPFTTLAIDLQGGRFDCPDRLFFSMQDSWRSCTNSMSDVKELIPEFFFDYRMFLNVDGFNFGQRQPVKKRGEGPLVDDVILPPWAVTNINSENRSPQQQAYEFVRLNRAALESDYVSEHLHEWIDLIFGYKQRGPYAALHHNIFFYLTYEGAVDVESISDPIRRAATEEQIRHFGQTPSQLFRKPHPKRGSSELVRLPIFCLPIDNGYGFNIANVPLSVHIICPPETQSSSGAAIHPGIYELTTKGVQYTTSGLCLHHHHPAVVSVTALSDRIIVVYDDFTVSSHKWTPDVKPIQDVESDKSRIEDNISSTKLRPFRFQWSTPKTIGNKDVSAVHWRENYARSGRVSGNSSPNGHRRLSTDSAGFSVHRFEKVNWWSFPSEQVFATPRMGPFVGRALWVGSMWDNDVKMNSIDTYKPNTSSRKSALGSWRPACQDVVTCIVVAEDGRTVGIGSLDCTCQVWRYNDTIGERSSSARTHEDYLKHLAANSARSTTTSKGASKYHFRDGGLSDSGARLLHVLTHHLDSIIMLQISCTLDTLISASKDGTIAIHTLSTGRLLRSIGHPLNTPNSVLDTVVHHFHGIWMVGPTGGDILAYSRSSKTEAENGTGGQLFLYSFAGDLIMQKETTTLELANTTNQNEKSSRLSKRADNILTAVSTADGGALITGSTDGVIRVRSIEHGLNIVRSIDLNDEMKLNAKRHHAVTSISLSHGYIVAGLDDGSLAFVVERGRWRKKAISPE